jgi:hypothetical protein
MLRRPGRPCCPDRVRQPHTRPDIAGAIVEVPLDLEGASNLTAQGLELCISEAICEASFFVRTLFPL